FSGSHRLILDYFVSEVLCAPSESLSDFLLRTSVLKQFSGALCDCITGRHDSAQQLAEMERSGLFLEALDRRVVSLSRALRGGHANRSTAPPGRRHTARAVRTSQFLV